MKVLKFGGSSVANAENIKKVMAILQRPIYQKSIIIVSAFSGVTDQLLSTGLNAAKGDESYKEGLQALEKRHITIAKNLLPVTSQSSCLSNIKQQFNLLEDIYEGVFRLGELSDRTQDRILSYGELLSSKIIYFYLQSIGIPNEWIDSREVILRRSTLP
jgi:aspartokinase/homoserine dehydrogenase 1